MSDWRRRPECRQIGEDQERRSRHLHRRWQAAEAGSRKDSDRRRPQAQHRECRTGEGAPSAGRSEKTKNGVAVTFTADGKQQKLEAEKILIAVGRKPNTENVGLEKAPRVQADRRRPRTA